MFLRIDTPQSWANELDHIARAIDHTGDWNFREWLRGLRKRLKERANG